jgi:hypothetical protein
VYDAGQRLRWLALGLLLVAGVAVAAPSARPRSEFLRADLLAFALAGLGLLSASWSIDPRLSLGRAVSFAVLVGAAVALGIAARAQERVAQAILLGALVGAVAVAAASGVAALVDAGGSFQQATPATPKRLRGWTQTPNTLAIVTALAVPIAAAALHPAYARTRRARTGAGFAAAVLVATLGATGSRGALVAALAAVVVLALAAPGSARLRAVGGVACAGALGLAFGVAQLAPTSAPYARGSASAGPDAPLVAAYPPLACVSLPPDDIGQPPCGEAAGPGTRQALGDSGRVRAWKGALEQAAERPLLGYGFGMEQHVFIDRFVEFDGAFAENSYIGTLLQMGTVGVALLAALLAGVGAAARALGHLEPATRRAAAAGLAVVAGGVVLAMTQSYLLSVGNVGTVPFWVAALLVVSLCAAQPRRERT